MHNTSDYLCTGCTSMSGKLKYLIIYLLLFSIYAKEM